MKIALVHDGIFCRGGGERVLLNMHHAFPNAPIYTSIYDRNNSYREFKGCNIKTTWFQKIASNEKMFKSLFFPFGMFSMQSHDFSKYDIILATTTHCAKYINFSSRTLVMNYCFTPFRLAWNPETYTLYSHSKGLKKILLNFIINFLKKNDFYYSQKTSNYIAMTNETSGRIKSCYKIKNKITIINPPINTKKYYVSSNVGDYYLVVSRLEKYKKVDLVINTFNRLGYKLKIVGSGVEKKYLKSISLDNIEFVENISDKELAHLYSKCKAFIFPQHEDYGLTPLEANASGRPVIAYAKGGVKTTMIPYDIFKKNSFTAIFFNKQTVESLLSAIEFFEDNYGMIDCEFIRKNAEKFDDLIFINSIRKYIHDQYQLHIKNRRN